MNEQIKTYNRPDDCPKIYNRLSNRLASEFMFEENSLMRKVAASAIDSGTIPDDFQAAVDFSMDMGILLGVAVEKAPESNNASQYLSEHFESVLDKTGLTVHRFEEILPYFTDELVEREKARQEELERRKFKNRLKKVIEQQVARMNKNLFWKLDMDYFLEEGETRTSSEFSDRANEVLTEMGLHNYSLGVASNELAIGTDKKRAIRVPVIKNSKEILQKDIDSK